MLVVNTASYCGYCSRAKDFLRNKGVAFDEVDVTSDDGMRAKLVEMTGRRTVPQIFVGEEPIGGYSDEPKHVVSVLEGLQSAARGRCAVLAPAAAVIEAARVVSCPPLGPPPG